MKERPILFSGPMVRAILEGRKTMTRRVVKPQPTMPSDSVLAEGVYPDWYNKTDRMAFWLKDNRMTEPKTWKCPYGNVGDRLWVRETWLNCDRCGIINYRADSHSESCAGCAGERAVPWKSSIHMFRNDSRITLEITNVRVERLQDITEEDALAEGSTLDNGHNYIPVSRPGHCHNRARDCFEELWIDINGPKSWDLNPWVWVIEFKRVEAKP